MALTSPGNVFISQDHLHNWLCLLCYPWLFGTSRSSFMLLDVGSNLTHGLSSFPSLLCLRGRVCHCPKIKMELRVTGSSCRLLAPCRPVSPTGSIQTHVPNCILCFNMPNNKCSKNNNLDFHMICLVDLICFVSKFTQDEMHSLHI